MLSKAARCRHRRESTKHPAGVNIVYTEVKSRYVRLSKIVDHWERIPWNSTLEKPTANVVLLSSFSDAQTISIPVDFGWLILSIERLGSVAILVEYTCGVS
jgi:hypothetical protein